MVLETVSTWGVNNGEDSMEEEKFFRIRQSKAVLSVKDHSYESSPQK